MRWRMRLFSLLIPVFGALGCGAGTTANAPSDGGSSTPGPTTTTGSPCTPASELSASFAGFSDKEVNVEPNSASCGGATCVRNHFRGRTSCPYGQDQSGNPFPGEATACTVPGTSTAVRPNDPKSGQSVAAQCADRTPDKAVYCSCRCANAGGRTDDGSEYCACPAGFSCTQFVPSIGPATQNIAGAYCVKNGTAYDLASGCVAACDPTLRNCG
jgi:hypothetical protein